MRLCLCFFVALIFGVDLSYAASDAVQVIPFQFKEGFIWVQVSEPRSCSPLHFLLDTGASVSVIDVSTAKLLGAKLGRPVKVQGVQSEVQGFWRTRLNAEASEFKLPTDYLGLDLSSLSGACQTRIDGLIGLDFFKGRAVEIDFKGSVLRVLEKGESSKSKRIPIEIRSCGVRIPIIVNGKPNQWVRLDTGCASGLQWVTEEFPAETCMGQKAAVGLTPISMTQTRSNVEIGGFSIIDVSTGLHKKQIFPGEAGLLGNGVLQKLERITIDLKSKSFSFEPQ